MADVNPHWNARYPGWDQRFSGAVEYVYNAAGVAIGFLLPDGSTAPISGASITVTGSRSLTNADDGQVLNSTSAGAVTLTIPAGLRAGFICAVVQSGAGQVTFSASGTTLNNVSTQSKTSGQYAVVMLTQVSTDSFVLSGSTGA